MPEAEHLRDFVFAALEQLGVPISADGDQRCLISVPPNFQRDLVANQIPVPVTFDKERFQKADEASLEFITPGSPILNWIIEQIRGLGSVFYAELSWDQSRASEQVNAILSQYQVASGSASMTDPVWKPGLAVQFHYLLRLHGLESRDEIISILLDERGVAITPEEARTISPAMLLDSSAVPELSVEQLKPAMDAATKMIAAISEERERQLRQSISPKLAAEEQQLRDYFQTMRREIDGLQEIVSNPAERTSVREQIEDVDRQLAQRLDELQARFAVRTETRLAGALVVGLQVLEGTVLLEGSGSQARLSVSVPSFQRSAPPFPCAKTGRGIHRIAVTADGRFVDADIVATCQHSRRVMPRDEFGRCSVSGKLYCQEFLLQCPIGLALVYRAEMVECPGCRQRVGPLAMNGGVCRSCAERIPAEREDARIQRVIACYPRLGDWPRWAVSETRDIYNLELARTFNQARLVLKKGDLAPVRVQRRSRILGNWKDVPFQEVTGEA